MKGVIFNLAEEVVTDAYGEDTWDALLEAADLEGAYTSLGNYPDDDLVKLVEAASSQLGVSGDDVVRTIGEGALPLLADRYPVFFDDHTSTRSFLMTLNDVIHSEVRKLYPGAMVPEFEFDDRDADRLSIWYRSERKLCSLAEGFILGAAAHYGETASLEQPECMKQGSDHCLLVCGFSRAVAA
jgi:hypothetical protein